MGTVIATSPPYDCHGLTPTWKTCPTTTTGCYSGTIYQASRFNFLGERRGSNPRVMESQSIALPLGYARQTLIYEDIKTLMLCLDACGNSSLWAGNVIRTRNVQLGRMALYHWVIPACIYNIKRLIFVYSLWQKKNGPCTRTRKKILVCETDKPNSVSVVIYLEISYLKFSSK